MSTLHTPDYPFPDQRATAVRTLDLVNVTAGTAWADDPADALRSVLRDHGESDFEGLEQEVEAVRSTLREVRSVLVAADRDRAALLINDLLDEYTSAPRLERHAGWDWHLHLDGDVNAPWHRWIGATSAHSLAQLLCSMPTLPWGRCDADHCELIYLTDGRGSPRRYCGNRCATRERVRRHRSR